MASAECKFPITGSGGHEALFDVHSSTPGDFVHPVLFEDETWTSNTAAEMAWVFFKGDPMSEPTPWHPFDMPFTPSTLFSIDLLDSANSTVLNVLPPTNSTPFWDAGAPFGHSDGKHMLAIPRFTNSSCPTNIFGLMMYRWTVPTELATSSRYRFRLSTNDSAMLHFSGEVTVRDKQALKSSSASVLRCDTTTFAMGGVIALGILLVLGWIGSTRFLRQRRVRYEPFFEDEKDFKQSWESKMTCPPDLA